MKKNSKKLIWIDFDNSPHVLFFDPIIIKLKEKGVETLITARDFAQVIDRVFTQDFNDFIYRLLGISGIDTVLRRSIT